MERVARILPAEGREVVAVTVNCNPCPLNSRVALVAIVTVASSRTERVRTFVEVVNLGDATTGN